jgi:glucose/arabinose dehydrogenase
VSGTLPAASAITYAATSASLAVTIVGLPAGTQANVSVSGPAGFTRTLGVTTTFELLEPGDYTVTASDVQATGKTYHVAPGTQRLTLTASTTTMVATVAYGTGNGVLDLTIAGLPEGTVAALTVIGPVGFTRTVTSSTTLANLEAGPYTISAGVVGSNLTTHAPAPASQTIVVTDDPRSTATVTYGSTPLQLRLELVAEELTAPVFLSAPDGDARLFLVERNGRIRIVQNGILLAMPFLDIRSRVNFVGERGMLSMAFDPQYATNGFFYVYYVDANSNLVLERFGSTPGSNVAGSVGVIVITILHGGGDHHGGLIAFGPDGMLYAGPGDGGCCGDPANAAQNTSTLLGKLLRIDVRTLPYTIPAGNPFVGRPPGRPEIWAYGLRNPWRFSFDAPTGLLFIGDVGQDDREEVNVASATAAGLNYGWRLMEGLGCFNPNTNCDPGRVLTLPVLEYFHSEGCSVTGGYVYRGSAIPELLGHYLYSDWCEGWLRSFRSTSGGVTERQSWAGIRVPETVSFGRDGAGELYMIAETRVWRIVRR